MATEPPPPASNLLDYLLRHVVALAWTDEPKENPRTGDRETRAATGFVISLHGFWFWVTAGHILHGLQQRATQGGRRIVMARLIDAKPGPKYFDSIPFTLEDTPFWFTDIDRGPDYGLIWLRPGFVGPLLNGGVVPLTHEAMTHPADDLDRYFLLGYPHQARRIDMRPGKTIDELEIELASPMLALTKIDRLPDDLAADCPDGDDRFYARVELPATTLKGAPFQLTDIDGMSGGPIFGFKRTNGRWRYWLVALQSAWWKSKRVAIGCPIKPLMESMEAAQREAQRQQDE